MCNITLLYISLAITYLWDYIILILIFFVFLWFQFPPSLVNPCHHHHLLSSHLFPWPWSTSLNASILLPIISQTTRWLLTSLTSVAFCHADLTEQLPLLQWTKPNIAKQTWEQLVGLLSSSECMFVLLLWVFNACDWAYVHVWSGHLYTQKWHNKAPCCVAGQNTVFHLYAAIKSKTFSLMAHWLLSLVL